MQKRSIENVLKEYTPELMEIEGVVGTGQGLYSEQPCIKVFVSNKTPDLQQKIPDSLDGYQVIIKEIVSFKPLKVE